MHRCPRFTCNRHTINRCYDWTCKDMVEDQADKDLDKDKDFTNSYLLQVAAKPTIAIKQQQ